MIDGNNLQFVSNVLSNVDMNSERDGILVICAMGPQSSGKSLVLNTLFGLQFYSSAARCTRGVYGSLISIDPSSNAYAKYKKILILDSEGIDSMEGRDESFDKRIIFYLLSVSHIALICNHNEMNSQTLNKLKVAGDSIANLRGTIITP